MNNRPDTLAVNASRRKHPHLTVVVFRSEIPGYFMAHWDFTADNVRVAMMSPGPTGLRPLSRRRGRCRYRPRRRTHGETRTAGRPGPRPGDPARRR
ncbi:LSU ribosomal protein L15p (L27Ae), mitochondrial [Actinacidiphila bryophytorum]|uniref:LSU ribosomal protein L15p (L27Ae), mitochondrial n=1 Tax=Actinacidiphila bryophytorum TaxID=1436133 RepID=A0A9W4MD44_9ACTN|nr:LSU ribosomal protein L15p (L27Ae), mitochondrial [Actinacidiphila bryophytorum]